MAKMGRPALPRPDLHPTVDAFLDMLTTEKGAADNTRQAYWRICADVSVYLRKTVSVEINEATTDNLKQYLSDLSKKRHNKGVNDGKIAVRTIARRLSALRQYYRFMMAEQIRADDPSGPIESPKQERTLPKTLSEAEVNALITTAALASRLRISALSAYWRSSTPQACVYLNLLACLWLRSVKITSSSWSLVKRVVSGWYHSPTAPARRLRLTCSYVQRT